MYKRTIYWFKRDLRLNDNRAFYEAYQKSREIIPIFIFIPDLLQKFKGYDKRLGFIIESIKYLTEKLKERGGKLFCYHEDACKVFSYLIEKYKPDAVFTVKAFSWTVENIEKKVNDLCSNKGVAFHNITENFLASIDRIPYRKVYSAFYKNWKENLNLTITPEPQRINTPVIKEPAIFDIIKDIKFEENATWKVDYGFKRIGDFNFSIYEKTRDRLDIDGTSRLSPYIRFGVISLRRLLKKALEDAKEDCQFIKELAWREFWYHIKMNFSAFNELEFQEKRRNLNWDNRDELIEAFINAKTGYPIIDAAIRQLKEEGWMHNRARMIVANFFTKDLLSDWRIGEKFFMEHLLDYDEVVNTGNWQWNASVGPDPRPLRIFNPILQAKKFDPYAHYIKKYLPELKNLPPDSLHDPLNHKLPYHRPIIDHFKQVILIKRLYQNIIVEPKKRV